jgi:hypothetical protein
MWETANLRALAPTVPYVARPAAREHDLHAVPAAALAQYSDSMDVMDPRAAADGAQRRRSPPLQGGPIMDNTSSSTPRPREPWNKGKLVGQKAPFKPKDIWAMRMRLQQEHRARDLALLNLGLDSKLRACDLVSLKVRDVSHGDHVASRATVQQKKTKRPVQFEITAPAREAAEAWIREAGLRSEEYLFPSRTHDSPHICTRQYARMLREWLLEIGLDWHDYGTHSMRRTKATLIYRKTKNLRAVQLLLLSFP